MEEFAEATGLSASLIRDIEKGRRAGKFRPATVTALEVALGWAPGSFDRVAAGGRPQLQHDPALTHLLEVWPDLSPGVRDMIVALVDMARDHKWDATR